MKVQLLRNAMRSFSAATILAVILGLCAVAGAAEDKKPPAPPKPPPTSGGGSGGGTHPLNNSGAHSNTTTNTHNLSTGGSHGPTANGPSGHGSGANDGGITHGTPGNGVGSHRMGANDGGITHDTTTHGPGNHGFGANDGGITHGRPNGDMHGNTNMTHTPSTSGEHTITGAPLNHGPNGPGATPFTHGPGGHDGAQFNRGPGGDHFSHGPGGPGHTVFNRPGPSGSNEHFTQTGNAVRMRPGGRVSDIHDAHRGIDVHNNLGGGRRVLVERPDHSRVFVEHGRPGYIERSYHYHDHDFGRRDYYYHGHEYHSFYRGYGYRGVYLNVYAPGYYYRPAFYGWAYHPWAAPITFGWGWRGNPWYGHYGYYFQPYAVYPSAAFWLTDYIIAQDLQAAYAAHQEAGEADGMAPPQYAANAQPVLTPEIKQMIADEVRNQLELENQEAQQNARQQDPDPASSGIARLLSDGRPHVFVAGGNLDVTDANGQECAVSDGDTLQLREAPPSDSTSANLVILSSKGKPECQISLTVQVQLTDLQEMQNHMRQTIDQGLKDLEEKQGTGGLPAAPPSAQAPPAEAQYASAAPPAEANLATEIQRQDQQSQQAEKDVTAEPPQESGSPDGDAAAQSGAPASIELGQTIDQVQAVFGAPVRVANLGSKVVYYYDGGMKVVFVDGKVSDVQ